MHHFFPPNDITKRTKNNWENELTAKIFAQPEALNYKTNIKSLLSPGNCHRAWRAGRTGQHHVRHHALRDWGVDPWQKNSPSENIFYDISVCLPDPLHAKCRRSLDPFYMESYYIIWIKDFLDVQFKRMPAKGHPTQSYESKPWISQTIKVMLEGVFIGK